MCTFSLELLGRKQRTSEEKYVPSTCILFSMQIPFCMERKPGLLGEMADVFGKEA